MKFQIASGQSEHKQEAVPKNRKKISSAQSEKVTVTEQKEDSYVKRAIW